VYSQQFRDSQAAVKFERIKELDAQFDRVRAENAANMKSGDERTAEHAACAALVMTMGLCPGSDEDTGAKVKAYGATTLLGSHVVREGSDVYLRFTGKKGVDNNLPVTDRVLARMLTERAAKAGPDGKLFSEVSGKSLLDYTHTLDGGGFKTKDFRTLLGTREAMVKMKSVSAPTTDRGYRKAVMEVAKHVATRLGNTPTVALQSYISPAIFAPWRAVAAK
jgi:DNA topoisomerase-1